MITVLVLMTFYDENGLHKAGSITKVKESDFNPDYMKKLNPPSPGGSTELSELDDVDISGVSDGEVLTYDAATEKWVNSVVCGGGSVINNIFDDGEGHVESMDIDGTTYEFGTGETTIDLSAIQTDSNGKVSEMNIDGANYEFGTGTASVSNISQNSKCKVDGFDLTTPDGTDTLEFVNLLEELEDVDITGIADGEVLTYQNGGWTYSAPTKIENISETCGVVDSMDINGSTYNFATGGGGGGGSSLVVTLTGAYQGVTIDLATMAPNSGISVSVDSSYADIKAADDIIFKIVDTTQAGSKYTLRTTGMHTLNVSADQSLIYTFSVITPSSNTPKVFKLNIGPWGNTHTFTCVA